MDRPYPQEELLAFWTTLAQRTCGGYNLLSSLEVIRDQCRDEQFRAVVRSLVDDVSSGTVLSEAMAKHPDAFRKHILCMVEGGERAGNLDRMFVFILESIWRCPDCMLG